MMFMSYSQKRNSKLESYLKRTLPPQVYDDIRYYESCVVKQPKENPAFKYVILTGKAVLVVGYPFRGVKEAVGLNEILDIKVEHDVPTFLKGSEGHKCQHIRIRHKHRGKDLFKHVEEEEEEEESETEEDDQNDLSDTSGRRSPEENTIICHSESPLRLSCEKLRLVPNGDSSVAQAEPESEKSNNTKCSPTNLRKSTLQRLSDLFRPSKVDIMHGARPGSHLRNSTCEFTRTPNEGDIISRVRRKSTSDFPEKKILCHQALNTNVSLGEVGIQGNYADDWKTEHVRSTIKDQSSPSPEPGERSISSLLRSVLYDAPRAPRSSSSMDRRLPGTSPVPTVEERSRSVLDRPRRNSNGENIQHRVLESTIHPSDDINIYVLHPKPILLNHLQTSWCTYLLTKTLQITDKNYPAANACDKHHLEDLYYEFKTEITNPCNELTHFHSLLQELLVGLQKRPELKNIFWKDQMLYHFLVEQLETYIIKPKFQYINKTLQEDLDTDIILNQRQDELETTVLVLDVFSSVLHDTENIKDKFRLLQFYNGRLLQELLAIIVSPPSIPPKFQNTCSRMLEDYNEFSTYAWKNLPESELISLLGEVTNSASALMYEVMITIVRLSESNALSAPALLVEIPLENYLKRSITQLLGKLFPLETRKLKPEDSVLIYQHFFVLQCLMEFLPQVHTYIREQYKEEFRYYIIWPRISPRLPECYPIKRVLQPLVEHLHRMVSCQPLEGKILSRIS